MLCIIKVIKRYKKLFTINHQNISKKKDKMIDFII